jgi:hypothetical protein
MWPKSLLPATSPNNKRPINAQAKVSQITNPYEAIPSYYQYQELQASALLIISFYKEGYKKKFFYWLWQHNILHIRNDREIVIIFLLLDITFYYTVRH